MSSPPTKYVRAADFSAFSELHPSDQQPGTDLDNEFDRIKSTTDGTVDRLALIQRDDGAPANAIVTPDALAASALALIAGAGTPRGNWAGPGTAYVAKDLAVNGANTYIAVNAHTSTGSFATDLAAGHWMFFAAGPDASAIPAEQINDGPVSGFATAPTGAEADGTRYIVNVGGTGAFAGKDKLIAQKVSGSWQFGSTPKQGQKNLVRDTLGWEWVYRNTWWNRLNPYRGKTGYQNFADVPAGTAANGIVIATGQTLGIEGTGTTSLCNNSRYEPSGNSYIGVPLHGKNVRMGMTAAWRVGHEGTGALTLAAGTKVAGAIITKMAAHVEHLYQTSPAISIWGGTRRTPDGLGGFLAYLAQAGVQKQNYTIDANAAVHAAPSQVTVEMMVSGNVVRAWADGGHWANSWNDDMVSGMLGDDEAGNAGYIFFQTGAVESAFLPYLYEIWWDELPGQVEALQDPKQIPDLSGKPTIKSKSLAFGSAQEVCRFTPSDGITYAFEVDALVSSDGAVAGYAEAQRRWVVLAKKYGGGLTVSAPLALYAEQQLSSNGGVITLSNAFTVTTSGGDVILQGNPTRTGADATAYSPLVRYTIKAIGPEVTWT